MAHREGALAGLVYKEVLILNSASPAWVYSDHQEILLKWRL